MSLGGGERITIQYQPSIRCHRAAQI